MPGDARIIRPRQINALWKNRFENVSVTCLKNFKKLSNSLLHEKFIYAFFKQSLTNVIIILI